MGRLSALLPVPGPVPPQGSVRELQLVSLLPDGERADVGVALEGERGLDVRGLTDRLIVTSQVSAPGRVLIKSSVGVLEYS